MARIAAIGDVHFEALRRILPGDSVALQIKAIRNVLRRCKELSIEHVIQVGDLFDTSQPDDDTKLRFADLLLEYGIRWIQLPGNHDRPLLDKHSLKMLDWFGVNRMIPIEVILEPVVKKIAGIPIFLCPHPYILDQPASAAMSVGHFPWTGAKRENGSAEGEGSTPKGEWLLGDFHEWQKGPRFRYVGSLTQVNWTESQDKSFDVIQTAKDGSISFSRQRIKLPYTLETIEVKDAVDLEVIDPKQSNAYYFIKVHPDVKLPADWQTQYPTIIRRDPINQTKKLKKQIEGIQLSDNPFEGLDEFLIKRGSLTEKQVAWSVKYMERGRNERSV